MALFSARRIILENEKKKRLPMNVYEIEKNVTRCNAKSKTDENVLLLYIKRASLWKELAETRKKKVCEKQAFAA